MEDEDLPSHEEDGLEMRRVKIAVGCVVEDRAWIIDRYLKCIDDLTSFTEMDIEYVFVMGNKGEDKTHHRIIDFMKTRPGAISLIKRDGIKGQISRASGYDYDYLARARNTLMALAFDGLGADKLFSIDSDILVGPEALALLYDHDSDVVAAPVRNSTNEKVFNFLWWDEEEKRFTRKPMILPLPEETFQVDQTGACVMIDRFVWESGVKYGWHDGLGGEDAWFAKECKEMNIIQLVNPLVSTSHYMDRDKPNNSIDYDAPELSLTTQLEEKELAALMENVQ